VLRSLNGLHSTLYSRVYVFWSQDVVADLAAVTSFNHKLSKHSAKKAHTLVRCGLGFVGAKAADLPKAWMAALRLQ